MRNVEFIESSHQYFVDGKEYISATTLIDRYVAPFNGEYWSRYKAIERVFKNRYGDSKGIEKFRELRDLRGYKNPGFEQWISLTEVIDKDEIDKLQQEILAEWKAENEESKRKGSAHHLLKELEAYQRGWSTNPFNKRHYKTVPDAPTAGDKKGEINLGRLVPGYYPELVVWNDEFKVIGTIDRVFISPGIKKDPRPQLWIDDYKTNKEIKKQNPYQKMKYPLSKLDDCNYNHYRLQIGLYAWMMEQWGYNVKGISINHMGELHKMRYSSIRPFVEAMLNHYAGKDLMDQGPMARYGFSDVHLLM